MAGKKMKLRVSETLGPATYVNLGVTECYQAGAVGPDGKPVRVLRLPTREGAREIEVEVAEPERLLDAVERGDLIVVGSAEAGKAKGPAEGGGR